MIILIDGIDDNDIFLNDDAKVLETLIDYLKAYDGEHLEVTLEYYLLKWLSYRKRFDFYKRLVDVGLQKIPSFGDTVSKLLLKNECPNIYKLARYLAFKGANLKSKSGCRLFLIDLILRKRSLSLVKNLLSYGINEKDSDSIRRLIWFAGVTSQIKLLQLLVDLDLVSDYRLVGKFTEEVGLRNRMNLTSEEKKEKAKEKMQELQKELSIKLMEFVHPEIVDICIAMSALQLPTYVKLWIVDELPNYHRASHIRKIRLIENIVKSIRKIKAK